MRTCQKCGQPNRNEARYCKWCGTLLEAVAQPSAGGNSALPEAADFIAKDNILPTFKSFAARCEHASEFIQLSGGTSRPGLDCIITGNAGTGKIYLADQLCSLLYRYKISDGLKPKHVDAADWDGFNGKLDENLAKIKKGVLLVTNCQDLVGDYKNALDKLFARMRKGTEMPVVILCGLEDGFGSYIRSNKHVSSLFEFSFGLLPFNDAHLTSLCSSIITGKFRTSISPEAQKKLGLVFKKKFRDGLSGENGKLSCRLAEAYTLNKIERCGKNGPLEEADIPDEPFKELTEEEIFEKLDSFVGLKEVKDDRDYGNYTDITLRYGTSYSLKLNFASYATSKSIDYSFIDPTGKKADQDILAIDAQGRISLLDIGTTWLQVTYGKDTLSPKIRYYRITSVRDTTHTFRELATMLRKLIGHLLLFAVTGIFLMHFIALFCPDLKRRLISSGVALVIGFAVAGLSELIQMMVPGRGPTWTDVGIDFAGFSIAVVFFVLLFVLIDLSRRHRRPKDPNTRASTTIEGQEEKNL